MIVALMSRFSPGGSCTPLYSLLSIHRRVLIVEYQGGLELSFGGTAIAQPDLTRAGAVVDAAAMPVRHALAGYVGSWLEQKPVGLTVHYRGAAPDEVEALRRDVAEALTPFSGTLRVVDGAMAMEIAPDIGWTKGTALRMIVEHVGSVVLPLYAGDDANDADALLAAADLGGITIGVGPRAPSLARYRLPDFWSLSYVLEVLLDMLIDSEPAQSPFFG